MDGLFKKTMSYLNSEGVVQDEFVGRIVEVAAIKLKILRKIAEGEWKGEQFFRSSFLCCYLFVGEICPHTIAWRFRLITALWVDGKNR